MKYLIVIKIISLMLLLSLGYCSVKKIYSAINDLKIRQEKISQQVDKLHVIDGHGSIPYRKYAGKFTATFYCPCEICVGKKKQVRTATGNIPHANRTIAVDSKIIPMHSIVYIKGLGFFVAEDTGGAIKGNRIDVYVGNHEQALKLGKKKVDVYILQ